MKSVDQCRFAFDVDDDSRQGIGRVSMAGRTAIGLGQSLLSPGFKRIRRMLSQ